MPRYTAKACPGCGAIVELKPNTVCHSCATAIRNYPEAKARLDSNDTRSIREYLIGDRAGIPSAIYNYKTADKFAVSFASLLRCVGLATKNTLPQDWQNPRSLQYSHYGILEVEPRDINRQDWRLFLPQNIEAHLSDLYCALKEVVKEAESRGQAKGQDLLMQLNAGTLSIADFDAEKVKCHNKNCD